jgi:hypothetical protein
VHEIEALSRVVVDAKYDSSWGEGELGGLKFFLFNRVVLEKCFGAMCVR